MYRTSRKQVKEICDCLGCGLVIHQELGNRANYYYTYSIVKNGKVIIDQKPLKEVYLLVSDMLSEKVRNVLYK